jgi:acetyl esterase/lipase
MIIGVLFKFQVMLKPKLFLLGFVFLFAGNSMAQEFIPIWPPGKKPNFNGKSVSDTVYNERIWRVGQPGIYAFVVPKQENTGTAVLICPGGGYERISHLYNGFNLARWYNSIGVSAFVLIYRLPHQQDLVNRQLAPLQDAQRAMKLIRANAAKWNIQRNKIGVMGTSAGGHLASMLGTRSDDVSVIRDPFDSVVFRPDFMVLLSPVISMGPLAHRGSRRHLMGADTSKAMLDQYSSELQVSAFTPPTFLVHAQNDSTVMVQNSLVFYNALLAARINASLHVFPQGGHGIRLDHNPGSTDLWMDLLEKWLKEMDFVIPVPFR